LSSLKACEASYAAFIETINGRRPIEVSKKSISAKRKPGYPPEEGGIVSLIELAANLDRFAPATAERARHYLPFLRG
jgi:hypothetical protein